MFTKSTYVQSSKENGKNFDDWNVSCAKEYTNEKVSSICFLSQQVNIGQDDTNQISAMYQIGYMRAKKN